MSEFLHFSISFSEKVFSLRINFDLRAEEKSLSKNFNLYGQKEFIIGNG